MITTTILKAGPGQLVEYLPDLDVDALAETLVAFRLVETRLAIEGGRHPVAALEHLAGRLGIRRFVGIEQAS